MKDTTYIYDDAPRCASRFTGKERDTETGLDYFGARYYGSNMGRFQTPDPLYLELRRLSDPQRLNIYAYTRNNPLKFTDPTGLDIAVDGSRSDDYLRKLQSKVSYKLSLSNGKIAVDKSTIGKKLTGAEKQILKAVQDQKNHVTIHAVDGAKDAGVFFGRSDTPHTGEHTIAFGQADLLDQSKNAGAFSSADLVGHETLEAYSESQGNTMGTAHNFANQFFGGLEGGTATGSLVQGGLVIGVIGTMNVTGSSTVEQITMQFVTPVPKVDFDKGKGAPYQGFPIDVEKKK